MAICKTIGCGVPGRPFPKCAICKRSEYCSSHCLIEIQYDRILEIIDEEGNLVVFQTKQGNYVCPICWASVTNTDDLIEAAVEKETETDDPLK